MRGTPAWVPGTIFMAPVRLVAPQMALGGVGLAGVVAASVTTVTVNDTIGILLVIGGVVLFGVELAHPGALLLIPGTIMIVAGLLYLLLPGILLGTLYGPLIVVLAAVAAAVLTVPFYRWIAPVHRPMSTTSAGLEGEVGVVIAPVVPDTLRGKVRVRSEIWSARAHMPIPAGTKVRVVGGEGVSIQVEPFGEAPAARPPAPEGSRS